MAAFAEIFSYLLQTALSLLLFLLLLHFLLQLVRADFYNPISQMLIKITHPVLRPVRLLTPRLWGIDTAALLSLLLIQMASIAVILVVNGQSLPNVFLLLVWAILGIAALTVQFYFFAILAIIILSWIAPGTSHPAARLLYQLTAPVMAPFRGLLPPMGGLDLSPILMFIAINIVQIMLRHLAAGAGLHPALIMGI
ncbi:MAG: YggT family protein [Halieaceae bacterium]|nr:YggT family protein [Halieaceae bacterium]